MSAVYLLWALAALALIGLAADAFALARGAARRLAFSALALKAVVVLSFAGWFIAERLGMFDGWSDLTTFATILVLSIPALGVALACDALALRGALAAQR